MLITASLVVLLCAGCGPVAQDAFSSRHIETQSLLVEVASRSARKRAWASCRRKYGRRLTGVTMRKRGRFVCHYRLSQKQMRRNCRRRYGKRFIRLMKTRKGYVCRYVPSRKQLVTQCRRQYGKRYLRLVRKNGKNICLYRPSRVQMVRTCRKRHGKRFLKLVKRNNKHFCLHQLTRQQAHAQCQKKHGDRFLRMTQEKPGRFTCWYNPTYEQTVSQCRKQHGDKLIDVIRGKNRYVCRFSPDGKAGSEELSTPEFYKTNPGESSDFKDQHHQQVPGMEGGDFQKKPPNQMQPKNPQQTTPPVKGKIDA